MSKIDNSGPAFPTTNNDAYGAYTEGGMSLRDWFAGQALPAVIEVCRNDNRTSFAPESIEDYFARQAYAIADAMLAARAMGAA